MSRGWQLLPALLIAELILTAGACSLTLDFDDDCSSDLDCEALGRGLKCVDGFCTDKQLIEPGEPCDRIYGEDPRAAAADSTIFFGVVLPRTGALGDLGVKMDNSVALAINEINQIGGVGGTKLGALSCDSGTDLAQGARAARHLIDVAGVDAIIGAGASSITIDTFNEVAKSAGVLMITPSATSPAISTLPDEGLLWRTAPSDAIQGRAIAGLLLQEQYGRVAVVNRDDAYGNGLAGAIREEFCAARDCSAALLSRSYDPESQDLAAEQQPILDELLASEQPFDVVVLVSFVSDAAAFMNLAAGTSTRFILTDGARSTALLGATEQPHLVSDEALLRCVIGSNPASPSGEQYALFEQSYSALFSELPGTFSANSYDATYVLGLAYAAARGASTSTITGRDLAVGLTRLTGGVPVKLGPQGDGWNNGVTQLSAGPTTSIDISGVSGPLDFDPARGEAVSGIEFWRFDVDGAAIVNLGVVLDDAGMYKGGDVIPASPEGTCLGLR